MSSTSARLADLKRALAEQEQAIAAAEKVRQSLLREEAPQPSPMGPPAGSLAAVGSAQQQLPAVAAAPPSPLPAAVVESDHAQVPVEAVLIEEGLVPQGPSAVQRVGTILAWCKTPIVLSVLTFAVISIILAVTKPKFTTTEVDGEKNKDGTPKRKTNGKRVVIIAGVFAAIVLIVPYLLKWKAMYANATGLAPMGFAN